MFFCNILIQFGWGKKLPNIKGIAGSTAGRTINQKPILFFSAFEHAPGLSM